MNIDTAIAKASEHFSQNYAGGTDSERVFVHYASDELSMNETDSQAFAGKATNPEVEEDMADARESNPFYTWYYLNYVLKPSEKEPGTTSAENLNWRIDLRQTQFSTMLDEIEIHPRCATLRNGKVHYDICFPDNAEVWSVFVRMAAGGRECIADCKNKFTAQMLAGTLKSIIEHWQIKILLDIKDASIQQVFSTHALKLGTIDRDVLESGEENPEMDMFREQLITSSADAGAFSDAIPIYEKEDEVVRAQLKRVGF